MEEKKKKFWKSLIRFLLQMLAAAVTAGGTVAGLEAANTVDTGQYGRSVDNLRTVHTGWNYSYDAGTWA